MRKIYGSYQVDKCFFCGSNAYKKTIQGFPTCKKCGDQEVKDPKCPSCGGALDIKTSKYGVFFLCLDCGPVSLAKYKKFNEDTSSKLWKVQKK